MIIPFVLLDFYQSQNSHWNKDFIHIAVPLSYKMKTYMIQMEHNKINGAI